ncbi:hypothetical protein N7451_010891 [Penicillium sp. IBT 35674x]|nr:hypothetical protein N7451_010891 [Penicillium sp. IBT 35674x]
MADSSSSSLKGGGGGSRSRRSWTVSAADSDIMESSSRSNGRSSIESLERPKTQAGETPDSAKAGSSGFSKLLKSRRRRKEKNNQKQADEPPVPEIITEQELREIPSNTSNGGTSVAVSTATSSNPSSGPPEGEVIQLLTDDSEPDKTPPLTSRNSHTGFYTSSSPLINTTSVDSAAATESTQEDVTSAISDPSATGSDSAPSENPRRPRAQTSMTLDVPDSSSKKRSVSPGRRLKEAFSAPDKDKKNTTEDTDASSSKSGGSKSGKGLFGGRRSSLSSRRAQAQASQETPPPVPSPIRTDVWNTENKEDKQDKPRSLQASPLPNTPPHTAIPIPTPATTVTPPTPTEHRPLGAQIMTEAVTDSPESITGRNSMSSADVTVSPSGNMISHRRVRSASAAHTPSKLSTSMSALTPLEEAKTPKSGASQQSGFFSSMFSAAQNAASSFTNTINAPPKSRPLSQPSSAGVDGASKGNDNEEQGSALEKANGSEDGKPAAVDTLGTGDLNFSHLDIDMQPGEVVSNADGVVVTKPGSPLDKRKNTAVYRRDEEASKLEDQRAARAVNMAYERPLDSSVLGSPGEDAIESQSTISLPRDGLMSGDRTPPSGSIIDGDFGSGGIRRTGSVRSRLARRHRGSSGATASTIGAIGASAINLGVPGVNSSVPRLTGFAVASKKRNRDFHQLFRSVPEDDYLIEDYSCALQREIILAGRIYISEGHICFSSNILGWVTTLVISFDEVVAIEKENTAMVFPNAIAIQTLHARHTFRSLLSRESTYDLMVNIWKINHPSLKSSVNGTRVTNGTGDKTEKVGEGEAESDTESDVSDEDEVYDEDEEGDHAESFFEAGASANASEKSLPLKSGLSRQPSGLSGKGASPSGANSGADAKNGDKAASKEADFPGPVTHAPTEYTNPDGQYEKVIKDELIPAPLGKVYSLVFGPSSGDFMTKFLVDNQKSGELQFEGTAKGLTNESRVRKYSYIKPLNAPIGPKQTKCISTENLDFLDLEKAVLVTLSTQTPDVPSGNVFACKTKYLFTWAPGNQTRFLMTCTIEWTGKSWLKGPIEKGAIDGQTTFGNELVKTLKAGVVPRGRTAGGGRSKGRRKKGDAGARESSEAASNKLGGDTSGGQSESWGLLEPIRPILEPFTSMLKPLWSGNIAILLVGLLLYLAFFRTPSTPSMIGHHPAHPGLSLPQRLAAYDEMWRREESELWNWLEDRVGMDGMVFPALHHRMPAPTHKAPRVNVADELDLIDRLREEKVSDREMDHAIRTTRQRLDILEEMMNNRRADRDPQEPLRSEL